MLDQERAFRGGAARIRASSLAPLSLAVLAACALAACSTQPNFGSSGQGGDGGGLGTSSSAPAGAGGTDPSGGAGGTTMSVSVSATVSVSVTNGAGGGCASDLDCVDGDPCTDDTCASGVCSSAQKAVGQPGNDERGECPGVCQLDGSCGLRLFSRPFGDGASDVVWSVRTLSELWGGEEFAPLFTDVVAADYLPSFDSLLVFTAEGGLHIRSGGNWQVFGRASEVFSGLPAVVSAAYSLRLAADMPDCQVTIVAPPDQPDGLQRAYLYSIDGMQTVVPDPGNPFFVDRSDEAGEPPAPGTSVRWEVLVQLGFSPTPGWATLWEQSDEDVYSYAEDGVWTRHGSDVMSPPWDAAGEGPASQSVLAAWHDGADLFLVAP